MKMLVLIIVLILVVFYLTGCQTVHLKLADGTEYSSMAISPIKAKDAQSNFKKTKTTIAFGAIANEIDNSELVTIPVSVLNAIAGVRTVVAPVIP
jgi:hypothetical protein